MNIEEFRDYCLQKKGTTEDFPFNESTLVFKLKEKIFAMTQIDTFESANLKCDPEKAIGLREMHEEIFPAYHMNKKHWNTVLMNSKLSDLFIFELIDHSYDLVFKSLTNKNKDELRSK